MRFGRHMPTESHAAQALRQLVSLGGDAMQLFVTNPRSWRAPTPNPLEEKAFRAVCAELNDPAIVTHAAYLINLASPREDYFTQSVTLLRATLDLTARLGGEAVVFHIGSHSGAGIDAGLSRLVDGIVQTLAPATDTINDSDTTAPDGQPLLLLENDTGGGGKLGASFAHLAHALDALPQYADRLGVCLDTAHLW
ncbi:MAG TPA: TIM barrel protein, partial [Ktedonobacterales bacterium]|nr:TIM barrel protein [Ktedonobacterales bacterium]